MRRLIRSLTVPAGAAVLAALVLLFLLPASGPDDPLDLGVERASADREPAGGPPSDRVPDQVLVRFDPDTDAGDREQIREDADATVKRDLPVPGLELLRLTGDDSIREAVDQLEREDEVRYAEPNFYRRASAVPNDPYFEYLWGLENTGQDVGGGPGTRDADIDAPAAWDLTTGSPDVTTAVVDTGVAGDHPDLSSSIWRNGGESGGGAESNGVDDDGNGLVDDWKGWDWVDRDNAPDDLNGHGTHVAGTVAARGNDSKGVVGVNQRGSVMPLRVLDADGYGTVADLISAYRYAGRQGAEVLNASLGGSDFSQAESDAIKAAPQTLFVVAAGNGGADGAGDDNDANGEYPCAYDADNVVCVAATNQDDRLASFSNYGARSVDLAAPGTDILSTRPEGRYAFLDGTSMATPHVAGVAGLLFAQASGATVAEVKSALLNGVDPNAALVGKTVTGGRANADGSLRQLGDATLQKASDSPPTVTAPRQGLVRDSQVADSGVPVELAWTGSDDRPAGELRYDLEVRVASSQSWFSVGPVAGTTKTVPLRAGYSYQARVRARDSAGNTSDWKAGPIFAVKAYQDSSSRIDYRGEWKKRSPSGAYGGSVRSSSRVGDRALLDFSGRSAGAVLPKSSSLGSVQICVDPGTAAGSCETVDLSPASGLGSRRLVFKRDGLDPSRSHKLRIKVVGGRVDLDALVLLR